MARARPPIEPARRAFAERGLGFGDRLGLGLRNSPEFAVSALRGVEARAVPVPVRGTARLGAGPGLEVIAQSTSDLEDAWIDATARLDAA